MERACRDQEVGESMVSSRTQEKQECHTSGLHNQVEMQVPLSLLSPESRGYYGCFSGSWFEQLTVTGGIITQEKVHDFFFFFYFLLWKISDSDKGKNNSETNPHILITQLQQLLVIADLALFLHTLPFFPTLYYFEANLSHCIISSARIKVFILSARTSSPLDFMGLYWTKGLSFIS